jgi:hypothetical protein
MSLGKLLTHANWHDKNFYCKNPYRSKRKDETYSQEPDKCYELASISLGKNRVIKWCITDRNEQSSLLDIIIWGLTQAMAKFFILTIYWN